MEAMDVMLERKSLTEQVQQKLLDYIREHKLKVGDPLPPEMELTKALNVSRSVIREALSRLRMLGLLESRKRRGMVVTEVDVFGGCEFIMDKAFVSHQTQKELLEMRMMLEKSLPEILFSRLQMTAENDEADHLSTLKAIVKEESHAEDVADQRHFEIAFHSELFRLAGNPLLHRFQGLLLPFWEEHIDHDAESVPHTELVHLLQTGTVHTFRRALEAHLRRPMNSDW